MSKKPETPAQMQARRADDKPTQSEFGQMVTRLAQKGVTGRALVDAISSAKTRRENAEEVKAWCRKLPKA